MSRIKVGGVLVMLAQLACSSLTVPASPTAVVKPPTSAPIANSTLMTATLQAATAPATSAPLATAEPTPAATVADPALDLEVLEWAEFPYANPADPSNTDTHVEVLIRNPNNFPVKVDTGTAELRFLTATGEVAYANPSAVFYIWDGEWMLPNETAALSACVCFQTSGLEKQDWATLELVAPIERFDNVEYTLDVEVTLGEFFNLAEAHLGGDSLGAEITITNTGDSALETIPMRVLARDTEGHFVGVAMYGNAVASFAEMTAIQPGDTATGVIVSMIDYVDLNTPLIYEVAAIGIPVR